LVSGTFAINEKQVVHRKKYTILYRKIRSYLLLRLYLFSKLHMWLYKICVSNVRTKLKLYYTDDDFSRELV